MDRSWMTMNRLSQEYIDGVEYFLEFAKDGESDFNSIRCPCNQCENLSRFSINEIRDHLFIYGINPSYSKWTWHGEDDDSDESPSVNVEEPFDQDQEIDVDDISNIADMIQVARENLGNLKHFEKLLEDAEIPLYEGCEKYTKLSAIVKLYNIKAKAGWSDKSFSDMLALVGDMLPKDNKLPSSTREARRSLFAFGMEYKKIHACPNDCILYRNEYENATFCPTCGTSRYKVKKNMSEQGNVEPKKGVAAKVLWYFPPLPRFKRWFQSAQTAKHLTWHASERETDDQLRHPANVEASR